MPNQLKSILIISDNDTLARFFQEECRKRSLTKNTVFTYCYSASNKSPESLVKLGARMIDLNNHEIVTQIAGSYDLVLSIHCKQIFPKELFEAVKCINIHPGLNPYNRGWYPQVFSLLNNTPIGATIHVIGEQIDHGEIIDQLAVEVSSSDTSLDVYLRVLDAEKKLIKKNLPSIINGEFSSHPPSFEGNYNSLQDFKFLCHLNLEKKGTLKEHIDLLRALSHDPYKNAYFIDEYGNKVFVSISLERE